MRRGTFFILVFKYCNKYGLNISKILRHYIKSTNNDLKKLLWLFTCKYYGQFEYFFIIKIRVGISGI